MNLNLDSRTPSFAFRRVRTFTTPLSRLSQANAIVFILVLLGLACFQRATYAQALAESFQYPLDDYSICQDFGHLQSRGVHTGQDVGCHGAKTPVRAIAAGKVLFAQPHGSVCDNWGYVLVIEHTTRFGKFSSIYGHIKNYVNEGQP